MLSVFDLNELILTMQQRHCAFLRHFAFGWLPDAQRGPIVTGSIGPGKFRLFGHGTRRDLNFHRT